jgi:asparaginyl-tRNA synthetase
MLLTIKELNENFLKYKGKTVEVNGWLKLIRDSKTICFLNVNDGSCFKNAQVVADEKLPEFAEVLKLNIGSALRISAVVVLTPEMKQPYELKAVKIEVEGLCPPEYPLQKKKHSLEFLREISHLRPRTNTFLSVFRVRSAAAFAIHKFFNERGFVYVHTPIITTSDCEGAGEMFNVSTLKPADKNDFSKDFFKKAAYLTVSGQLQAEAYALAFNNVYTFGPTFRAENSNTARHAAEFWMVEPEIAFADLDDCIDLASDMLKYVVAYVLKECHDEIAFFDGFIEPGLKRRLENILEGEFVKLTYTEAVEILSKVEGRFEKNVKWGDDLQTEHERYICEEVYKGGVFLTDYPKGIKSFYMRLNDDGKTVRCSDMLVPGIGELIGGSQREERYEVLRERMKECGLDEADYKWYLDLRKFGGVKHGGFGLGFERLIMYLTGVSNIRDVLSFPRTPGNADI